MKRLLLVLSYFIFISLGTFAQSLKMCHSATIYVQKFDEHIYLIVGMDYDEDKNVAPHSVLKMKLFDGEVIRLEGVTNASKTTDLAWSTGTEEKTSFVVFEILKEQVEKLKKGVNKLVVNTLPELHKDTFKDKSFSDKLYELIVNTPDEWN